MSSVEAQKVVLIQDASTDVSSSAIRGAIRGLSLKPGDELTLLSIIHEVYTPMGYKIKVAANSMLGANQELIEGEVSRKVEEYENSIEMLSIRMLYEKKQIIFHTRVVAASSPKAVALDIAMELGATWIILDRQMKKEKKYFMERLPCGISSMKSNKNIQLVRVPIQSLVKAENIEKSQGGGTMSKEILPRPMEKPNAFKMIEENPEEGHFCLEFTPKKSPSTYKNSSKYEAQTDKREGNLRLSVTTSFLSTFSSSENAPYLSQDYKEKLTNSSSESVTLDHISMHDLNNYFDATKEETSNPEKEGVDSGINNVPEFGYFSESEEVKEDPMYISWAIEPKVDLKIDFTYEELYNATKGFSDDNFLSEGGFGCVYKGKLKDGQYIAVKQLNLAILQGEEEFKFEVDVLSKVRHKNVVMLLGSCSERRHQLLVYEYASNGSLDTHLSKNSPSILTWRNRLKIALGAARGLNYLHQKNMIHRELSPSNILIRNNYEPLLGDFGLAREQREIGKSSESETGTIRYLAPEYDEKGVASAKTDVYSFGIVLLQLITGLRTMDKSLHGQSLLGWAKPLLNERKYLELVDERILDSHDVQQVFCVISVAEKCLRTDPKKRPSMVKVEYVLQRIVDGAKVTSLEEISPRVSSFSSLTGSTESQSEQDSELRDLASNESSQSRKCTNQAYPLAPYTQETSRSVDRCVDFELPLAEKKESYMKRREARYAGRKLLYDEMLS